MKTESQPFRMNVPSPWCGRVLVAIAALLSLGSIFVAHDFGNSFEGRLRWVWAAPALMQSLAVAAGLLLAWIACRMKPGRYLSPWTLFLAGMVVLCLPFIPPFAYSIEGVHRWIDFGNPRFYLPVDSLGVLLVLPQLAQWATNEHGENTHGQARKRITPSAAFALSLVVLNLLFLGQRSHFGVLLINSIAAPLWFSGRLERRWKTGVGVIFALLLALYTVAGYSICVTRAGGRPFPQSLSRSIHATRYFHCKVAEATSQERWLGYRGTFPQPTKTHRPRPEDFCEYVPDVVRLRFGFAGLIPLVLALAGFAAALLQFTRSAGTLESRLQRTAWAAYLLIPMCVNLVRTLTDTRILPAAPFPFLSFGFTITTTAWIAVGLLLREARSESTSAAGNHNALPVNCQNLPNL